MHSNAGVLLSLMGTDPNLLATRHKRVCVECVNSNPNQITYQIFKVRVNEKLLRFD
jgi:hypothetical protein